MYTLEQKETLRAHDGTPSQNSLIADKLCGFAPASNPLLRVRPIRDTQEAISLYRLIYREYLIREFCRPHGSGLHCTYYCFFPESRTLLLEGSGETLGTLSLITDTECGLPMEAVFPEEIANIRSSGQRLAEISLLAFDFDLIRGRKYINADIQKFSCAFYLFKGMFAYARKTGITDLVMAVHPKLERLYQSLGFSREGNVKAYSSALGKPAVAMHMNIATWMSGTSGKRKMKNYFLADSGILQDETDAPEWDPLMIRILLSGRDVPVKVQKFLVKSYPGLRFNEAGSTSRTAVYSESKN